MMRGLFIKMFVYRFALFFPWELPADWSNSKRMMYQFLNQLETLSEWLCNSWEEWNLNILKIDTDWLPKYKCHVINQSASFIFQASGRDGGRDCEFEANILKLLSSILCFALQWSYAASVYVNVEGGKDVIWNVVCNLHVQTVNSSFSCRFSTTLLRILRHYQILIKCLLNLQFVSFQGTHRNTQIEIYTIYRPFLDGLSWCNTAWWIYNDNHCIMCYTNSNLIN